MTMTKSKGILLISGILAAALPCLAQYGGRPGDTVIYVFTSKGTGAITTQARSTVNTAAGLQTIDPATVTPEPFPPDFVGEHRVLFHNEPGDVFEFVVKEKTDKYEPLTQIIAPAKVLVSRGQLRITPAGEDDIDAPTTFFTTFPKDIVVSPNYALSVPFELTFWTNSQTFPIGIVASPTFVSPVPPPGVSGAAYIIDHGIFPALTPWQNFYKLFPNVGWVPGTDVKVIDQDPSLVTTARLIRLRPGRKTPPFSIAGNTHILVLQGSVQIAPAGGAATVLPFYNYAFVPPGYSITLSNPAVYSGPK